MNMEEIKGSNKKIALSAFIFSFLMVVVLHAALVAMIRNDYEQSGEILTNQIIDSFYLPIVGNADPKVDVVNSSKYQDFISQTSIFLKNYPAAVINIYNQNSKKIFSSNTQEIIVYKDAKFMDYVADFFLEQADRDEIGGKKSFSQIIWLADFGMKVNKSFVRVVEPMNVDKTRVGTVEIIYDFSHHLWMLDNTRFFCLMLVISIIASYFILIDRNFKEMQALVDKSTTVSISENAKQ